MIFRITWVPLYVQIHLHIFIILFIYYNYIYLLKMFIVNCDIFVTFFMCFCFWLSTGKCFLSSHYFSISFFINGGLQSWHAASFLLLKSFKNLIVVWYVQMNLHAAGNLIELSLTLMNDSVLHWFHQEFYQCETFHVTK